ncbi:hypothetical protein TgHK011_001656 [Trichoderma gracile]|nr:hypothetical protein TgHK011_001656 [Trichoderma gracile]
MGGGSAGSFFDASWCFSMMTRLAQGASSECDSSFHVRNLPGQLQRQRVSVHQGGSDKRLAFTATCNAKAIIHDEMGPLSDKHATLLVFEFEFNAYKGDAHQGGRHLV